MSDSQLWVNGRLIHAGEPGIDPRDRGFTLGDGLFETLRVRNGVSIRLAAHLARLQTAATSISLPLAWTDTELAEAIDCTLAANALREAVVRITVSRGVPLARGLMPESDPTPSLVIHAQPFAGYSAALYQRGMRVITSRIRRNQFSPVANLKSLGYLDNVLARREAAMLDMDEALMLNTAGELACATAANLFVVLDGVLMTPPLTSGVLPGTVRSLLLAQSMVWLGQEAQERQLMPDDLRRADEVLLTSALLGVMPLTTIDGHPIGTGLPGRLSARLRQEIYESE